MRKFLIYIFLLIAALSSTELSAQYNKRYFYFVGRSFIIDSKYNEAIETLNIMLKADPEAYEGYFLRGIAKYNLDDLLGAEMDFSQAIYYNPVFTTAYQYRAITRSRLANYDDALNDFNEAIDLRPDIPDTYYSRGVTFLLSKQYEKAIDDFDMFIKREDKVADAYLNRGTAYLSLKDTTRAYEEFNKAIVTNRESPLGYNRLGNLYASQDQHHKAIEEFSKAIGCDSTYIPSLFNRAIAYSSVDKPLEAIDDFSYVISVDSTISLAYFNRALMRSQTGDYNNALEDYNDVVHYSPNNVLVYYNRAALQYRLGNLVDALSDYSKAIELYPDFANAYLGRSNIRYLLNDPKSADEDRKIAELKIEEYRSKLNDSTFSIYADTSRQFNKLLSFETDNNSFKNIAGQRTDISMQPLFYFGVMMPDTAETINPHRYYMPRAEDFMSSFAVEAPEQQRLRLVMINQSSDLSADSLLLLDRAIEAEVNSQSQSSWQQLFKRGVTQAHIKQYTNAINSYSQAIERDPSNPFLYINRGATRADMIDFVSSIDNSFSRLTIDSDPANRLKTGTSRTYDYSEAIGDMTKAIKLYPEYAYAYYNRANLYCLSSRLPEALEDYTRAIELNPAFADAYFNRGLLQIYLKDTRKGCMDISKAGELGVDGAYEVLKIYSTNN
ncbi:MAG: tetratricopeptide repeat protein [Rikenellaceae bacterium]